MKIGNLEVYGVIYKITNKIDNKSYIGQTTVGFEKRYHNNVLKYTHNRHLKSAIKKYGINNFIFNNCVDIAFSEIELNIKEKVWINLYDCYSVGYNLTMGGEGVKGLPKELHGMYGVHRYNKDNPFYGKKHTEKVKKVIGESMSKRVGELNPNYGNGNKIAGKNNPMYGISPKDRMDKKTYNQWLEKKKELSTGINNPNAKKIINLTTGEIFDYIKDAIKVYGEIAISACCRGKCKTAGKCKWMYYKDYLDMITRGEVTV